jgi:hypothetical protein
LSCADWAIPPATASAAATVAIVSLFLVFIVGTSLVRFDVPTCSDAIQPTPMNLNHWTKVSINGLAGI